MRIKLSVVNRLSLLGLLSNEGDLTTVKMIRELREELSFTQDEHALLKFKPTGDGKVIWNEENVPSKKYEFIGIKEILVETVKTKLREMEDKKVLKLDYLDLYETLIELKGQEEKETNEIRLAKEKNSVS